jgi:hypothetical protein
MGIHEENSAILSIRMSRAKIDFLGDEFISFEHINATWRKPSPNFLCDKKQGHLLSSRALLFALIHICHAINDGYVCKIMIINLLTYHYKINDSEFIKFTECFINDRGRIATLRQCSTRRRNVAMGKQIVTINLDRGDPTKRTFSGN